MSQEKPAQGRTGTTPTSSSSGEPLPCWLCGSAAVVDVGWGGYIVFCGGCYDPSPTHSLSGWHTNDSAWDESRETAIEEWNERVLDREAER